MKSTNKLQAISGFFNEGTARYVRVDQAPAIALLACTLVPVDSERREQQADTGLKFPKSPYGTSV